MTVQVTVSLLLRAMTVTVPMSASTTFTNQSACLIDGFPRNLANLEAWQEAGQSFEFAVQLTCSGSVCTERLLRRQDGRSDDAEHVIARRLQVSTHALVLLMHHVCHQELLGIFVPLRYF
jgi:adenylate kinase family enzyme